ncbi:MAG TPA: hypothetical protein VFB58_09320 [Chloroflexota bacterium]|nr:hypothetical protein [Chloroflexota bacterium]
MTSTQNDQHASVDEQWVDAGKALGEMMDRNITQALQPVLNTFGEEVAEAIRQQLQRARAETARPAQTAANSEENSLESSGPAAQGGVPAADESAAGSGAQTGGRADAEQNQTSQDGERVKTSGIPRYARIMTTTAMPGTVLNAEDTIKLWREQLAGVFENAQGFLGAYVLGNPGTTEGITITLWESELDAMTSHTLEDTVPEIRPFILGDPEIEGYQVLFAL